MKKKYRQSVLIALAILCLLLLSNTRIQAQENSKSKASPGIQLMLLSEEKPTEPNIVFVTSAVFDGNLGGLVGADQKCQALAVASGLPKNTYRAWLSTPSVNAIDRLGSARGWVRVDGKPFADTKADIAAGRIFYPIRVDEFGNYDESPYGSNVWTGTTYDGTVHSYGTCTGWTTSTTDVRGAVGSTDGVASIFTLRGPSNCDLTSRLYCFGIDNKSPVTVKPVAGRIAFHTKNIWLPSNGVAAADQQCMEEAQQAGLNGNFKALLATEGASAASRFDSNGLPWVRPDGVAIAPTAAGLFAAEFLDTSINQSADGLQYFGNIANWTGGWYPTWAGTSETTCNNWTSSSNANTAVYGVSGSTYQKKSFGDSSAPCNAPWIQLYCLQE